MTDNATAKSLQRKGLGLKPVIAGFNATSAAATPNATLNVNGAAVTIAPDAGFSDLVITDLAIIYGGTFGAETATVSVTATFSDGTTSAALSNTATATGTNDLSGNAIDKLTKSGQTVKSLQIVVKSSINSSTVSVTATAHGTESV